MKTPPVGATPNFLEKHYLYELVMLKRTHAAIQKLISPQPSDLVQFGINTLVESFAIHARSLIDFFGGATAKTDDAIASHFTAQPFTGTATAAVSPDVRDRMNKQIAHLTYTRETPTQKFNSADQAILLQAIDTDHKAFVQAVLPQFAWVFLRSPGTVPVPPETPGVTNTIQSY